MNRALTSLEWNSISTYTVSSTLSKRISVDKMDLQPYHQKISLPTALSSTRAKEALAIRKRLNKARNKQTKFELDEKSYASNDASVVSNETQRFYYNALRRAVKEAVGNKEKEIEELKQMIAAKKIALSTQEYAYEEDLKKRSSKVLEKKALYESLCTEVHKAKQKLNATRAKFTTVRSLLEEELDHYINCTVTIASLEAEVESKLKRIFVSNVEQSKVGTLRNDSDTALRPYTI